jgi:phosphate transport system substrate-binding protein
MLRANILQFSVLALIGLVLCTSVGCAAGVDPMSTAVPVAPTPLVGRLTFAGSTTMQPLVEKLAERYRQYYPDMELEVAAGGSVVGINAIQEGSADIGMSSRELQPDELQPGIERFPVAIDVLAVIVHPSNPVRALTQEQLYNIYTGRIVNWREVGGADLPILPVIREVSSGTRGAFDDIALDGATPVPTADVQVTAGEVQSRVANRPDAIGYVGFGNISTDVTVLEIDGAQPTPQTALAGTYRLQRPLILLISPLSRRASLSFIEFALSEEGQRVVQEDGWTPVNPPSVAID